MSENNNSQHVRWEVFVFIIGLITVVFAYFATKVDTRLESIGENLHQIDKRTLLLEERTKIFESFTPNQTNMLKNSFLRVLNSK